MRSETYILDALDDLRSELRKFAIQGIILGWAAIMVAGGVAYLSFQHITALGGFLVGNVFVSCVGIGVSGVIFAKRHFGRRRSELLMPTLTRDLGLSFKSISSDHIGQLPDRLLPSTRFMSARNVVSGIVSHRHMSLAQVEVRRSPLLSDPKLFRGIVAEVANVAAMPPFLLTPINKTNRTFNVGKPIEVSNLEKIEVVHGRHGRTYDVWADVNITEEDKLRVDRAVKMLLTTELKVGKSTELFSILSNGRKTYIALTYLGELFELGGYFARDFEKAGYARDAANDLKLPSLFVDVVLSVEIEMAKLREIRKTKKPPEDLPIS